MRIGTLKTSYAADEALFDTGLQRALLAALVGVHRAGCGYVPVDPAYPRERVDLIVRDSGSAVAVGEPADLVLAPLGPEEFLAGKLAVPEALATLVAGTVTHLGA